MRPFQLFQQNLAKSFFIWNLGLELPSLTPCSGSVAWKEPIFDFSEDFLLCVEDLVQAKRHWERQFLETQMRLIWKYWWQPSFVRAILSLFYRAWRSDPQLPFELPSFVTVTEVASKIWDYSRQPWSMRKIGADDLEAKKSCFDREASFRLSSQ